MIMAQRLQTHDHQSWSSNVEPGYRRVLPSGVENEQCLQQCLHQELKIKQLLLLRCPVTSVHLMHPAQTLTVCPI